MDTALVALTRCGPNDTVNSRKNPLEAWRRLQKRYDPTTGGRKRNFLRTTMSPGRCSLLELQAGIERLESYVSRCEKKLKDKLDDEIKLAGLEALVLEELASHLILNLNRLRTFEDARLEIVTYVETKFGLRIRDYKPSETGPHGHSDPMDVDAVNSLSSGEGKGSSSTRDECFMSGGAHFQRDCNARKEHRHAVVCQRQTARANRASHGPRVRAKARVKKKRTSKGKSQGTKGAIQHRKLVYQIWKTRHQRQARKLRNLHKHVPLTIHGLMMDGVLTNGMMAGVWMNGMMTGVLLDGTKVGNKRTTILQAHFHLEVWILVPRVVRNGLNG